MNKRRRNISRVIFVFAAVAIGIFAFHSAKWNNLRSNPVSFVEEDEGPTLRSSKAKELATYYDNDLEYCHKYLVEYTYSAGSFPSINVEVDTLDVELWHRKRRQ